MTSEANIPTMEEAATSGPEAAGWWRRWIVVGSWLTIAMFVSELVGNVWFFRSRLGSATILQELSEELGLLTGLAADGVPLLVMALMATAVVAFGWAAVCLVTFDRWRLSLESFRGARLLFWLTACFAFLRTWYSLHQTLLPGSRLHLSPLFVLVGSHELPLSPGGFLWTSKAHLVSLLAALGLVALVSRGLFVSRSFRLGAPGVVVGGVVLFSTYSSLTTVRSPAPFTRADNVVVIGLDSFQMNRLSVGGARTEWAPHINEFVAGSLRFDNAWTPIARTYPSWVSILSGRYPPRHGVRFNLMPDDRIAADNRYLPDLLGRAGYSSLYATDETRFSIIRKRHSFDDVFRPRTGLVDWVLTTFVDFSASNLARQTHLGHDLFPVVGNNRAAIAYSPRLWADNLISRLDELPRDRPNFIAIHLCGNHWPWTTPPPYSLVRRADDVQRSMMMVDDQVGEILGYLEGSGLKERSTVVMLSDHGDGYRGGRDEWNDHGNDFERINANKVILGFQAPGMRPAVVPDLVRTIDLHPTLLELVGLDVPADIDGESLVDAIEGRRLPERSLLAETGMVSQMIDIKRLVRENAKWYELDAESGLMHMRHDGVEEFMDVKEYMLIRGGHRLVVSPHTNEFEIFPFDESDEYGGVDRGPGFTVDETEREELLTELSGHFELDRQVLREAALMAPETARPASR